MKPTVWKKALGVAGVLAVLCVGLWWGGHPADMPSFLRSAFVSNPHDVVIDEALSDIQRDFFRPIGRRGLINGAIKGAVASLGDPYAAYQTPKVYNDFNNPPAHPFAGVGITVVAVRGGLRVQEVLPGSPADLLLPDAFNLHFSYCLKTKPDRDSCRSASLRHEQGDGLSPGYESDARPHAATRRWIRTELLHHAGLCSKPDINADRPVA